MTLLHVLVTISWNNNTIIIGIENLVVWGIISPSFPIPSLKQTDVLAVHGDKTSPSLVKPPRRLFDEPDYSNPEQVEMVLS